MKRCSRCTAWYQNGRWHYKVSGPGAGTIPENAEKELCPGCENIAKRWIEGVIHLKGGFFQEHRAEIEHLIHNISEKKRERNPAARIIGVKEEGGELVMEVTDRALAESIGREVERAFSGKSDIQWLKKAEYVRVFWQRD